MKKLFIIANWKMNPQTSAEAKALFDSVAKNINSSKNAEIVICPPFLYILSLTSQPPNLKLGGQNCFYEANGAYTGEISPAMLKNLDCDYVILGHSERRKHQGETDEIIKKKIESALKAGLKPIVCIDKLSQLKSVKEIDNWASENLLIAYEPLHCIGNGNACDPKEAEEMRLSIRKEVGENMPILYGGSVNAENAQNYINVASFDGLLVGGASLRAEEFAALMKSLS